MKIYLNLLPEERKKAISRRKRLKNIIKQEIVFLLPIILFVGILSSINLILKIQNDGIDNVIALPKC
ncbi:MAG: hypothetical protein UW95_C0016G0017 [Parcubacteria group bacterium GW2011_GWC1_45_14]|nr:MAG: hypothetical protein UW95_C0016G0017 [Parcubacteria group bacterium GW2011_GWC1_45_14]